MKRIKWTGLPTVLLLIGLIFLSSCGGGSSTTTNDTFSATDISNLPKATSPMASSASASVAKGFGKAASVGMSLATIDETFFSQDSGMGACEIFNLVKQSIGSAAQADMILCFVSLMSSSNAFQSLTDSNGDPIDIYDGNYHIFNLNITDEEEGENSPDRVKMKIVKDSSGAITFFEMFMCSEYTGTLLQNEYTKQQISGASLTMRALGQHGSAEGQGWHSVDVSGTLDANGHYTSKQITVGDVGVWNYNPGWQEGVLVQTPGAFEFSGYRAGSYSDNDGHSGTYQDAAFGAGELLGDTSDVITDLALGDGAVQFYSQGTYSDPYYGDGVYGPFNEVVAWLGDSALPLEPATDSAYYVVAEAGTLPTIETEAITISFTTDEQWDCSDDADVGIVDLPEFSSPTMNAACSVYMFNHNWINCHEIIDQGPQ